MFLLFSLFIFCFTIAMEEKFDDIVPKLRVALKAPSNEGSLRYVNLNKTGDRIFEIYDGIGTMFEIATQKPLYVLQSSYITACYYYDPYICTAHKDGLINIWDSYTGSLCKILKIQDFNLKCRVNSLSLSNDGKFCAIGWWNGGSMIVDCERNKVMRTIDGSSCILRNGLLLIQENNDYHYKVYDFENLEQVDLAKPVYSGKNLKASNFDPKKKIFYEHDSARFKIVNLEENVQKTFEYQDHINCEAQKFLSDGIFVDSCSGVYNLSKNYSFCRLKLPGRKIVALSGDGKKLLVTTEMMSHLHLYLLYSLDKLLSFWGKKDGSAV